MNDEEAAAPRPAVTPGRYLRLRREADGLSIEDLALMIDTTVKVCARERGELLKLIEADVAAIGGDVVGALRDLRAVGAFAFDPHVLWQLIALHAGAEIERPAVCGRCGCSWMDPCQDEHHQPCAWADAGATLCTTCAARPLDPAGDADADEGTPGVGRLFRAAAEAHRLAAVRLPAGVVASEPPPLTTRAVGA